MVFNTGAALLDAVVLAVVSREEEGTYGYKITQDGIEVCRRIRDMVSCPIIFLTAKVEEQVQIGGIKRGR